MDDKARDFVECLFCDMLEHYIHRLRAGIDLPKKNEPKRCVPVDFHLSFVNDCLSIEELINTITGLPVLLCWSADLFKRFTNSVCLKLIDNVDPEVDFLKVMFFLTDIMYTSFEQRCYRWLDEIPKILETLLKERIQTKFYEENGFDAIAEKCRQLNEDEKWCESTVEEIRTIIIDSFETELAATERPLHDELFEKRARVLIEDVNSHEEPLSSNEDNCPFCDTHCISFLRAFFEPRIGE